jgi:hypothetical protein
MAMDIDDLGVKVRKLRDHYHLRDARWADLLSIRQGNIQQVFPELFSSDCQHSTVTQQMQLAIEHASVLTSAHRLLLATVTHVTFRLRCTQVLTVTLHTECSHS